MEKKTVKLNIGAGQTEIEGFIPVDRNLKGEAYPLAAYEWKHDKLERQTFEDDSVDEIRASHILEHFGRSEVPKVLQEWVRVLKPGGKIRIAVPDFEKIKTDHRLWDAYLMGGQIDNNDYHKSVFTNHLLHEHMVAAGLTDIHEWESTNADCASLPISLNLEGVKATPGTEEAQWEMSAYNP